jgi:antitoxin ParD1/3/4
MMSTGTMNIALPDTLRAVVAQRVACGDSGHTSEYLLELIRKDQREQLRQRLRALV